jgi:hypothetical protein
MMMRAMLAALYLVDPATWHAVYHLPPSWRVVASVSHARERSVRRLITIAG